MVSQEKEGSKREKLREAVTIIENPAIDATGLAKSRIYGLGVEPEVASDLVNFAFNKAICGASSNW